MFLVEDKSKLSSERVTQGRLSLGCVYHCQVRCSGEWGPVLVLGNYCKKDRVQQPTNKIQVKLPAAKRTT